MEQCDYLIDLDLPHQSEEHYLQDAAHWEVLYELPFLDAANSPDRLTRAFFIPGYSRTRNSYAPYVLLRRRT